MMMPLNIQRTAKHGNMVATRIIIDQIDATLFAEQRRNNAVIIKVEQCC